MDKIHAKFFTHPTQVSIFFYQYFHEEAFAIDLYEGQ